MQLHERFKQQGLSVIMLSAEPDSKVESYPTDNSIPFIVATTPESTLRAYNITGFPTTYLIDGNGRVAWEGHPMRLTEGVIEEVLKTVTWVGLPEVPASLAPAKALFEARRYGDAAKKAEAKLKTEKDAAEMILRKVDEVAERLLKRVETDVETGHYPDAFRILDQVQAWFKGLDVAKRARDRESELKKDRKIAGEMKAFAVLSKVQDALSRAKSGAERKQFIPALEKFIEKYPGYYASREAEATIRQLKTLR